jgi:hypothetical protein
VPLSGVRARRLATRTPGHGAVQAGEQTALAVQQFRGRLDEPGAVPDRRLHAARVTVRERDAAVRSGEKIFQQNGGWLLGRRKLLRRLGSGQLARRGRGRLPARRPRILGRIARAASKPAGRLRSGYGRLAEYVRAASGGSDAQIQHFFARGMLSHLVSATGARPADTRRARTLGEGIVHYDAVSS